MPNLRLKQDKLAFVGAAQPTALRAAAAASLACFRLELMIFVNIQRSSNASASLAKGRRNQVLDVRDQVYFLLNFNLTSVIFTFTINIFCYCRYFLRTMQIFGT